MPPGPPPGCCPCTPMGAYTAPTHPACVQVTKLPAIRTLLPPIKKIDKNPAVELSLVILWLVMEENWVVLLISLAMLQLVRGHNKRFLSNQKLNYACQVFVHSGIFFSKDIFNFFFLYQQNYCFCWALFSLSCGSIES